MQRRNHTKKIILTALFAAVTCVFTMIHLFPSPLGGYIHIGDCFVLLSGFILGPIYGSIAAATGSALADLFAGYAGYAAATFIIKFLMAFFASLLFKTLLKAKLPIVGRILGGLAAEAVMIGGYYLFSAVFLGVGFVMALETIPGDAIQGAIGIIMAIIISEILRKSELDKRILL